jgi:hypothetical protein
MASKRILNRLYWVAVKADASARTCRTLSGDRDAWNARSLYRAALKGTPDSGLLPYLIKLESTYGTCHTHADLANRQLWESRRDIDSIREATLARMSA